MSYMCACHVHLIIHVQMHLCTRVWCLLTIYVINIQVIIQYYKNIYSCTRIYVHTHIILYIHIHAHVLHARTLQLLLLLLCIMYSAQGTPQVFICIMQWLLVVQVFCVYTAGQHAVHCGPTSCTCGPYKYSVCALLYVAMYSSLHGAMSCVHATYEISFLGVHCWLVGRLRCSCSAHACKLIYIDMREVPYVYKIASPHRIM